MIAPHNGEVCFSDGIVIRAHTPIWKLPLQPEVLGQSDFGWVYFTAGRHESEHGTFELELACSHLDALEIFLVVLWSVEPFFEETSAQDRERAIFHEGILARDLRGQREFSWGEAFCKYNRKSYRSCLNVVYTAGPKVPAAPPAGLQVRWEHSSSENSSPLRQSFTRPGQHSSHEAMDLAHGNRFDPIRGDLGRFGYPGRIVS
jgi:hypothetical protein